MPPPKANGITIGAMVLGIASLVLLWIPVLGGLLGAGAVILGIVGLVKRMPSKGFSITGLITGGLGFLLGLGVLFAFLAGLGIAREAILEYEQQTTEEPTEESLPGEVSGTAEIIYLMQISDKQRDQGGDYELEVRFTADDMAMLNGDFGHQRYQADMTEGELIWEGTIDVPGFNYAIEGNGEVSCSVSYEGEELVSNTAQNVASCSGNINMK